MHKEHLPGTVLEVSVRIQWRVFIKHPAQCLAHGQYSAMLVLTVTSRITPTFGSDLCKIDLPFPFGSWALPSFSS